MKLSDSVKFTLYFFRYLYQRMKHDRINVNAGYLTYITLLSFVPMLTVLVSVLSFFSFFENAGQTIQTYIITNFVPTAGDVINHALNGFVSNAGKGTAMGGLFLFIAALMLISNIDKNLNYIWRVNQKRKAIYSFSMYWLVLTSGPILVGSSIALTSYITSLKVLEYEAFTGAYQLFLSWLPFLLSVVAFLSLYILVPNKQVKFRDALLGAAASAILFELAKKGFAFYITQFPSYQVIYGTLATIPITILWIYLCWMIVLIGAEITASLGESEEWCSAEVMLNSDVDISRSTNRELGKSSDSANPESE
ncbi:virulence factor BrkB family protein [Vibrio sp. HN007]|uniref:virulence factor BrkB family protein n=1 Tax=Vibrio iocasae TaxID=3098914 RepID=UPI0035D4099B